MNDFFCKQYNNFSIKVFLQQNCREILIECQYLEINKYSSVFNFENLKNIDILFAGFPPFPLTEAYKTLCRYFEDNSISIIEVSNSKIIIEIEKYFQSNMTIELIREKNIYNNKNKYDDENIINKEMKNLELIKIIGGENNKNSYNI